MVDEKTRSMVKIMAYDSPQDFKNYWRAVSARVDEVAAENEVLKEQVRRLREGLAVAVWRVMAEPDADAIRALLKETE